MQSKLGGYAKTLVERGIDEVRATPKTKYLLRLFAICGIFNLLYFGLVNVPYWGQPSTLIPGRRTS